MSLSAIILLFRCALTPVLAIVRQIWGKHTNFELGTRVPLIFRAPHLPKGVVSNLIVESVDLYELQLATLVSFVQFPEVCVRHCTP